VSLKVKGGIIMKTGMAAVMLSLPDKIDNRGKRNDSSSV
jgi:hypothetical protein